MDQLETYASIAWEPTDLIELRPLPIWSGQREWVLTSDLPLHLDRLQTENSRGANIYAGILPRIRVGGGTSADVACGRVLWGDFDWCPPEVAQKIIEEVGLPPASMIVNSGHGAHVFWRLSAPVSRAEIADAMTRLIDFFLSREESKKYIDKGAKDPARILRLPGFVNHRPPAADTSIFYACADARYDLAEFMSFLDVPKSQTVETPKMKIKSNKGAWNYISKIDGSAPGGRTTAAFRVAAILSNDMQLPDPEALELLSQWDAAKNAPSIQFDPKYGLAELEKILTNAKRYAKNEPGCKKKKPPIIIAEPETGVDISGIMNSFSANPIESFPEEYLNVPGFIGDIMEYNNATAPKRQPVLALAGALALQAVLCSRKIADEYGTRPNMYICGVALSGAGKEHARKINKDILIAANGMKHHAEGLKSGSALITAIVTQPSILFQIDEYGRFLRASYNPEKNPHAYEIISKLLTLYTSSNSIFESDRYADADRGGIQIRYPHASLYGTTVPRTLYDGLRVDSVEDGFLARTLIFDTDNYSPKLRRIKTTPVPKNLISRASAWLGFRGADSGDTDNPDPVVIPETDEAKKISEKIIKMESAEITKLGNVPVARLWTRTHQHGAKLSLLYAASRWPDTLIIDAEAALWGYGLSEWMTRRLIRIVGDNVADNQYHALALKIKRYIDGAKSKSASAAELSRAIRLPKSKINEAIEMLVDWGCVEVVTEPTRGRTKTIYLAN